MAKHLNRLSAQLALKALRESTANGKNWIVSKGLILETDEKDIELVPGDAVEIGGTENGDVAIKSAAAVVVVADPELAARIADVVVSADEMSDVQFIEKPALDAAMDGEDVDQIIDKLVDGEEGSDVEVAELEIDQKESVEAKFEKFANHTISAKDMLVCEAIQIDESAKSSINMATIKKPSDLIHIVESLEAFNAKVASLKGAIQPGAKEIALSESGKVIGMFDKELNEGKIFLESEFDTVEDMEEAPIEAAPILEPVHIDIEGDATGEVDMILGVDSALAELEAAGYTGDAYIKFIDAVSALKPEQVAEIVSTFDSPKMAECVRVFDTTVGQYVAAFKESVSADNFIAESGAESRFTKRFFA